MKVKYLGTSPPDGIVEPQGYDAAQQKSVQPDVRAPREHHARQERGHPLMMEVPPAPYCDQQCEHDGQGLRAPLS